MSLFFSKANKFIYIDPTGIQKEIYTEVLSLMLIFFYSFFSMFNFMFHVCFGDKGVYFEMPNILNHV